MKKAKELADIIKARRASLGYTQTSLATKVGVTRQCVSLWEMGEGNEFIKASNLAALERALECKPGDLLKIFYSD